MRGSLRWIYHYDRPVYDRIKECKYWLCRYFHINKKLGGNTMLDLPHLTQPTWPDAS
jgi:hypothetical protein